MGILDNSLYEFIYIDDYRLKSLIAQINNEGILLEYQKGYSDSFTTGSNENNKLQGSVEAGIKFLAKGEGKLSSVNETHKSNIDTTTQNQNLKYDATFASPVQLFQLAKNRKLISSSLNNASYGSLIHIQGSLKIIDTEKTNLINKLFSSFVEVSKKTPNLLENIVGDSENAELLSQILAMLKHVPKTINATFYSKNKKCWSTLDRDSLKINPWDYTLKSGALLQGDWHCLALLDSKPAPTTPIPKNSNDGQLDNMLEEVIDPLREFLGIAKNTYGITPILIFRNINN